ncbi:MAG: CDP-alcohol phosphatidyltransferase family protein [Dehalococcoidia bacterium]|nr:CDP-alcohol phosphatidyltransferase family protein [Dehalococcoidia bacterium]
MTQQKATDARHDLSNRIAEPVARFIARSGVSPNTLTWLGLLLNIGVAAVLAWGHLFPGGFLVLAAGAFDLLDGAVARVTGATSKFGALLDSTVDRFSEAALLFGILVFFAKQNDLQGILAVFLAMVGSFAVSYVRARAEGLGIECGVGWFTRPERVILLAVGLLLSPLPYALPGVLWILAVMTNLTAGQRIYHVWKQTKKSS